jgi:hypothetical protein
MKMLLLQFAVVGALMTSSAHTSATGFDHPESVKATQPFVAVAGKTRKMRIVDGDYRFSDQELTLIAFVRLKADAERGTR